MAETTTMAPSMAETTTISSTVYWAMLSLGAANLLPWLSFLTLADYFLDIYGDNSMEFYFPAVSTTVLVGAATLNLLYGQALSFDVRVRVPTFVMAASLLAVPLVDLAMRAGLASRFIVSHLSHLPNQMAVENSRSER